MRIASQRPRGKRIEDIFAIAILCCVGYSLCHAWLLGYLPSPFFYEPSDTFGDWYNPAYWARQGRAAYDVWGAFYPPLSFAFLKYVGIDSCYPQIAAFEGRAGIFSRSCDWVGLVVMGAIVVVNAVLTWFTFRKIDRSTAVNRTICLVMGMPMLQAVERGNLLMLAYTFVLLGFGPLLKSSRLRIFCAAIAINLKLYLIGAALALLLKKRWRWTELALLSAVIIYLVSFAIYGSGSPWEIAQNLRTYQTGQARDILDTWFASTYGAFLSAIDGGTFPLALVIGSRWSDRLEVILPALQLFSQLIVMAAAIAVWFRPAGISTQRAMLLGLLFIFISTESGIYILLFLTFFILQERWRGFGRIWAISACYLLAIPIDVALYWLPEIPRETYFWNTVLLLPAMVPVGPLIRPLAMMTIAWAIALITLNDVRIGMLNDRKNARISEHPNGVGAST